MESFLSYIPLDIALIAENFDRFLYGVWTTLNLTVLALVFGGLLAIPMAIARASRHPVLNPLIWSYTYVLRGTPLLVQTYLIYYGLGQFEAVRQSWLWDPILSSAWWCALIAFTLNTAAYTTELLRGAIVDTPKGEVEAAIATGHSYPSRMRRIILPSAFRRAIPAYSNEVIFMLHGSVVASTITLQDILGVGRWLNGRYYLAYEGFITAALLYFLIVFAITRVFRWIERRYLRHLARRETGTAAEMTPDPTR
ncbi:MAG: ABC transporter permease [Rhodobacteraceae bacterium]|nr:MAG: ABC transporter permease [Paracoccaceae bacterium]